MTYVALAELAVILFLVVLLQRQHNAGVKALLDVVSAAELERAELLNAARHPNYMLPHPKPAEPPREPTEEEKVHAANYAKIGTVESPA